MVTKRNILKNGIANVLQKFVRVLEQLLLVPVFITTWGATYYGEWLTLTIIPSVLAFSDLGFGSAAANSFTLQYVAGDHTTAANIERTGFTIISWAVLLGIAVSVIIMLVVVHLHWFDKSLIFVSDAVKALVLMIAARLISFYNQLFSAHFIAARRATLSINLLTVSSVLHLAVGAVVFLLGGGVVQFALWQCVASVVFNLFYCWQAISVLGLHRECRGRYDKIQAKKIFLKGFGYLASPVWQAVLFQGTTFVVRLTLGPLAVTIFNTVRTLTRSVNQMYSLINGSVFPELQFEIGAGRMEKAQKLFLYSLRLTLLLSVLGVAFLAIFGLPLYNWWTQKALTPPLAMWYIFLLGVLLNAVWWTACTVFRAMNKPYPLAISGIAASVVSIVISYFCCKLWNLNGAALGSLVFEVIMMFYILPVSCKQMEIKITRILNIGGDWKTWKNRK
jgi:O-antigen/teichoic acid export membrane protein